MTVSDPAPCKLYRICFEAVFDIELAAPVDMPVDEVRTLIKKLKAKVIEKEAVRFEWEVSVPSPEDGDANDSDRNTWVVDDGRAGLVRGEETAWLPEPR